MAAYALTKYQFAFSLIIRKHYYFPVRETSYLKGKKIVRRFFLNLYYYSNVWTYSESVEKKTLFSLSLSKHFSILHRLAPGYRNAAFFIHIVKTGM